MIDSEIEMKELGRKHPTNTHSKRSLIRTSHVCHRRRAARRNHQVEEYKHTHTVYLVNISEGATFLCNLSHENWFRLRYKCI